MPIPYKRGLIVFTLAMSANLPAQAPGTEAPIVPFQDNSFILEEAYNQEAGVVQHITLVQRGENGAMDAAFTQEWPMGSQRHQFSYTVPLSRPEGPGAQAGLGDIALNYRLQAVGSGETKVAISPRLSLNLPSGKNERGRGSYGIGFGIPISYIASKTLVTHTNLAVLHVPGAREADGRTGNAEYSVGQSVIFQAYPQTHFMLESLWTGGDANSFIVSPAVRFALNFKSGLQIVPGFAIPYETRGGGSASYLVYLSVEHPFAQPKTGTRRPAPLR